MRDFSLDSLRKLMIITFALLVSVCYLSITEAGEAYIYDPENRILDHDSGNGTATTYQLDPYGNRVQMTVTATSSDADGDGLLDSDEVNTYHTNPNDPDTDHDGLNDKYEVDHSPCCDPLRSLADINKDGAINTVDFNAFKNAYRTHAAAADVNCDGTVNTVDFNLFKNAYRTR